MNILHYFLGFPPYRTGGMTEYAYGLMQIEADDGHTVAALWPGRMGVFNHTTSIKKRRTSGGIQSYELINPLPVPLDEGITEFAAYTRPCNPAVYEAFFKEVSPNVIHIHTLMGLHKEFVDVSEKLHIRTIFTTHDYFGICPKVTLYRAGAVCGNDHHCEACIQCNCRALSIKKITVMQSFLYRFFKNFAIVKQCRRWHREKFFTDEEILHRPVDDSSIPKLAEQYQKLRGYYIGMLEKVDCIHFNSSVAENVYKKYLKPRNSQVITITHRYISDNRNTCEWKAQRKLRITFLSPAKPSKGFNVLKTALDELWESGKREFVLKMFSPVRDPSPYMKIQEKGFQYSQLREILQNTDVLAAPSVWYETFGFTVLEAISYGVPVIVSDHVGAKDIVGTGGIVIKAGDTEELKRAISGLTIKAQERLRKNIKENIQIKTLKMFMAENYQLYRETVQ